MRDVRENHSADLYVKRMTPVSFPSSSGVREKVTTNLMGELESPEQQEWQEQVGAKDVCLVRLSRKRAGSSEPSEVEASGDEERQEAAEG